MFIKLHGEAPFDRACQNTSAKHWLVRNGIMSGPKDAARPASRPAAR